MSDSSMITVVKGNLKIIFFMINTKDLVACNLL